MHLKPLGASVSPILNQQKVSESCHTIESTLNQKHQASLFTVNNKTCTWITARGCGQRIAYSPLGSFIFSGTYARRHLFADAGKGCATPSPLKMARDAGTDEASSPH
jgi:hypothetical protein